MPWVVHGLPEGVQRKLSEKYPAPCPAEDQRRYQALAKELALNTQAILPPTSAENCVKGTPISPREVLLGPFTDDPDSGIDRDPPDVDDPFGDRQWMGGLTGPGSQGFRHQFWTGWRWLAPIDSFQVPPRAMGRARDRAELMAVKARELFLAGDWIWGARVLAWALHYVQDLTQPYHSDQIPTLRMVPWGALVNWPPARAAERFMSALNHSLTNYHWAVEGYVMTRLSEGPSSPFAECLMKAGERVKLKYDLSQTPFELADLVARESARLAPDLGYGSYAFFGAKLKTEEVSLPQNRGTPNYAEIAIRPDLVKERQFFEGALCEALSNTAWVSHRMVEWTLRP